MNTINPERLLEVLEHLLNLVGRCESLSRNKDLSAELENLANRIQDIINTVENR